VHQFNIGFISKGHGIVRPLLGLKVKKRKDKKKKIDFSPGVAEPLPRAMGVVRLPPKLALEVAPLAKMWVASHP
jgi:hypothetical protein